MVEDSKLTEHLHTSAPTRQCDRPHAHVRQVASLVHEDPYERWDYYLTLLTATAMVRLCARAGLKLREIATLFCGLADGDRDLGFDFLSVLDDALALAGLQRQTEIAWMCADEGRDFAEAFCRCFEDAAAAALAFV